MAVTGTALVLRALGLGDLLTAVPALRALRRAHPGHHLVLAAPRWLAGLAHRTGAVDEVHPTGSPEAFCWGRPPPDLAVNLHGHGPGSIDALLSSGARRVLTHRHRAHPELDGPRWLDEQHEVHRWCRLLRHGGVPADPDDLLLPVPGGARRDVVLVHPGASHGARRWPPERFAAVAGELAGRVPEVLITGSGAERSLALEVARRAGLPDSAAVAGRTDLLELAALVGRARLVVCGDTGMAHLATASGTPSVVLFGPVPPRRWGPPEQGPHTALWAGTTGDTFAEQPDPGLLRIPVGEVLAAADARLAPAPVAEAGR